MKANGMIDINGNEIEFIPPAPTENERGGIYASTVEDTSDMSEVKVGADGKGYVEIDKTIHVTSEEKKNWNDYATLTLGVHTDGLIYIFKNGTPMGVGVEVGASGDVVGYIDEDNNIVLSGTLAEDIYTVKYEMEDGTLMDIGTLSLVEDVAIINQIPLSTDADGNLYNDGQGWKTGYRLSSSSGSESASTDVEVTGFIPAQLGDTIYIKNIAIALGGGLHNICFYDSSKTFIANSGLFASTFFGDLEINGEVASGIITQKNCAYIRISAGEITDDSIITVNQVIE